MDKKQAITIIKARNKARKRMNHCRDALWSGGDGTFSQRQDRLKLAEKEFDDASFGFSAAMRVVL